MKSKVIFCLTLVLLLIMPNMYSKPKQNAQEEEQDLSLFEIDRLIRKTEYDEALRQLNVYIENNPENFDNAQIRIKRIMNARIQYSILAEKLIDLILNDPNNNKEIYEITAQLEKFERHPSDQNLQFIADLKKSAEFNYFRSLFLEIQTESANLTQQGKYIAALAKVQEGFWLYKDNFYVRWEDDTELLNSVDQMLLDLDLQIKTFGEKNFLNNSAACVKDFVTAVDSENFDEAVALCSKLSTELESYISLRNSMMSVGVKMQKLFDELKQIDEDSTDASFLPFMFRFIFGVDTIPDSGIAGAVDAQWNIYVQSMHNAVYNQLTKRTEEFLLNPDEKNSQNVAKYALLEKNLLDINNYLLDGNAEKIRQNYSGYYVKADFVTSLTNEIVRICKIGSEVESENNYQQKILTDLQNNTEQERAQNIKNLFDSNEKIGTLVGVKTQQELANISWAEAYNSAQFSDWKTLEDYYSKTLENIFAQSALMLDSSWKTLAQYYKDSADNLCKTVETHNQNTEKYFNGFYVKIASSVHSDLNKNPAKAFTFVDSFEKDENLNFGVYYSYPDISLGMALVTQEEVESFITEIDGYKQILRENYESHEQWMIDENITEIVNSAEEYLDSDKRALVALKQNSLAYEQQAKQQSITAQLAQNEADMRYAEAEAALSRDNFDLARKKLQDAATKYDESLKNQDDEKLRLSCDEKLFALGDRITKGENEIVVREVRQLKNKAKDAYLNGRFDDAEKYLSEAKLRWAVTNTTEDSEIINLMNFVNTAVSMKTGREILPSAPQYPEMSQLLNIANQYYVSGMDKIAKGQKDEGFAELDIALTNIQKVQYTYPLNRDASLLTLRINKLKDSVKFNDELSQKIELAKMMCQRKESQQEGYANLLDYYDIEPNYKGLKDLIYQIEISIGIRQKPVDNSGAKKADQLFAEAQKMFKNAGSDQKKLEAALAKVDEAIMLKDTDAAQSLKDQITIKIGGTTSVTLSTDDERLYRSAIAKLQSNDIFGANIIVQQLLKNPRNANSQQIKDLKSKVDARL